MLTRMKTLDELALQYRTDKGSIYHGYTKVYERYFDPIRMEVKHFLELGIGDINSLNREGQSALMWQEYFPNAKVLAIDNDPVKVDQIRTLGVSAYCVSQDDPALINQGPFDIIVDDASHQKDLTVNTFRNLWQTIKSGGYYVIEDVVAPAFWGAWGGSDNVFESPFLSYFFEVARNINLQKVRNFPDSVRGRDTVEVVLQDMESITFSNGLIIMKKI